MDIIESLTLDDSPSSHKLDRILHDEFGRLYIETYLLRELAWNQLNLPKNKCKPDFNQMNLEDILSGLSEEVHELNIELYKEIDFIRAFEELGDVVAYLTGLIAWLLEKQKEIRGTSSVSF